MGLSAEAGGADSSSFPQRRLLDSPCIATTCQCMSTLAYALCGKLERHVANMDPPGTSECLCDLDDGTNSKRSRKSKRTTASRSNFGSILACVWIVILRQSLDTATQRLGRPWTSLIEIRLYHGLRVVIYGGHIYLLVRNGSDNATTLLRYRYRDGPKRRLADRLRYYCTLPQKQAGVDRASNL